MSLAVHSRPGWRRSSAARAGFHVLGVVGELFITLGVLILGFLVWQLWWTDVVADKAQAQIVDDLPWVSDALRVPTGAAPSAAPGPAIATPRRDEPPVEAVVPHATTFATMTVPRWDPTLTRPVSEGTDRPTVLDVLGIGHYEGTAMPGAVGNFAVAGHRTTFGKPFNRIEELQVGDPVVIQTAQAWYVYRVTGTEVVHPGDAAVIAAVPGQPGEVPTQRLITMTTCHPMLSARQRYIVHGELAYWAPVDSGVPAELVGTA